MAGYAVSARVERAAVQVGRPLGVLAVRDDPTAAAPALLPLPPEDGPVAVDLVGRPFEVVLEERLAALRETWAQTTFFLFDAEGWR